MDQDKEQDDKIIWIKHDNDGGLTRIQYYNFCEMVQQSIAGVRFYTKLMHARSTLISETKARPDLYQFKWGTEFQLNYCRFSFCMQMGKKMYKEKLSNKQKKKEAREQVPK